MLQAASTFFLQNPVLYFMAGLQRAACSLQLLSRSKSTTYNPDTFAAILSISIRL